VVAATADAIPLYPRRRLLGSASGGATSIRRGGRADVASSRPYRPGDHFRTIDWKSSARLSSARRSDEFIVRERFAEEVPAVVIVVDRRPAMALYPPELPWLQKPAAVRAAARVLVASALNQRALVAYLDYATHPGETDAGTPFWEQPRAQANVWRTGLRDRLDEYLRSEFDAPEDNVERALEFLSTRRSTVPIGSFVFVLSDFIVPTPADAWAHAVDRGWDVVPVIVQDPVWEQSFPEIDGVAVSLTDARGARPRRVRLGAPDVKERRRLNEDRLDMLRRDFVRLGLDPVLVGASGREAVRSTLLEWTQARLGAGKRLR
jgi:uncharacterized protein (DUF58 family)